MSPDLEAYLAQLEKVVESADQAFGAIVEAAELEDCREEFLARQGRLKQLQRGLSKLDFADMPLAGKRFNESMMKVNSAYQAARLRIRRNGS